MSSSSPITHLVVAETRDGSLYAVGAAPLEIACINQRGFTILALASEEQAWKLEDLLQGADSIKSAKSMIHSFWRRQANEAWPSS